VESVNWTTAGNGIIMDGGRIVGILDKHEDAKLICQLVSTKGKENPVKGV